MNEMCSICKLNKHPTEIACEFCNYNICEDCERYCDDVSCFIRYRRHCKRKCCVYCLVYQNRSRDFLYEIREGWFYWPQNLNKYSGRRNK